MGEDEAARPGMKVRLCVRLIHLLAFKEKTDRHSVSYTHQNTEKSGITASESIIT